MVAKETALQALRDVADGRLSQSDGESLAFPWWDAFLRGYSHGFDDDPQAQDEHGPLPEASHRLAFNMRTRLWTAVGAERCPVGKIRVRHKDPGGDIWKLAGSWEKIVRQNENGEIFEKRDLVRTENVMKLVFPEEAEKSSRENHLE